ncbi:MAG: ABC transporter permease [Clostridiales Family XIII bacterium]|jgi:NitT/TauT family transport system permease protein|nr:ABC transporter permease [Clostridiales Family XIII bacterium]
MNVDTTIAVKRSESIKAARKSAKSEAAALGKSAPLADLLGTVGKRGGLLIALLLLWEFAPRFGWVDDTYLPALSTVLGEFGKMFASGELFKHLKSSLVRSFAGYFIAIVVGIPLGLLNGWSRTVSQIDNLLIEFFRNTSALALLPCFILFLGIGETSKIAIVAFACLWPIILNTISGVREVDPMLIMFARSLGLSDGVMFRRIILPASLPSIFTGLRISSASAVLVIIAAEMVGAKSGLGFLITNAQFSFRIPAMYVGILTTTALGIAINYALIGIERKFTAWKPRMIK